MAETTDSQRNSNSWIRFAAWCITTALALYGSIIGTCAWRDTRATSGLDLKPSLGLKAWFKKIGDTPPHFEVWNEGPIDAVQLEIQLISHRYFPHKKKILVTGSGSNRTYSIPKLSPQQRKGFLFPKGWLNSNARLQEPPEHNVMEIRLTYRRESDKHQFSESSFYFVDPEGRWVSEFSSSLTPYYEPIKQAALEASNWYPPGDLSHSDRLHPRQITD